MNILEKMIRDLETMAASNPNRPLGDYWFHMREDGSYRKAMCALMVFEDRASFEDEARAGLTGATLAGLGGVGGYER